MTTFQINHRTDPLHGQTLTEHPTIARYNGGSVTWVCLVTGERQSKWYALSNLREVKHPNDSGLDYCYPQPLAPVQGCALPPHFIDNILALAEVLNSRPTERQKSRDLYVDDLNYQIAEAVAA